MKSSLEIMGKNPNNNDSNNRKLSKVEINQIIEPKFCKIITPFGEGTGYIYDSELGLVFCSFHLLFSLGQMIYPFDPHSDDEVKLACILRLNGYVDSDWHLTYKALQITAPEQIHLAEFNEAVKLKGPVITTDISIQNGDAKKLLASDPELKNKLYTIFQQGAYERTLKVQTVTVEIEYQNERLFGMICLPPFYSDNKSAQEKYSESLQIIQNYAYFDTAMIGITHFEDGTPYFSKQKILNTGEPIKPLYTETDIPLMIGEKVYFGGFPLKQTGYMFSSGVISSIQEEEAKRSIIIQAPILPGHSGSPIFVQRDGKMYWIGTITSEIAVVSNKMHALRAQLKTPSTFIQNSNELSEIVETLLGNLSTGKGKAIEIANPLDLLKPELDYDHNEILKHFDDFLVPHPTEQKEKQQLFEFIAKNNITRLKKSDLIKYLRENADADTRKAIYSNNSYARLENNRFYLSNFNAKADSAFSALQLTDTTLQPNNAGNEAYRYQKNKEEELFKNLYECAHLVSQGKVKESIHQYTNENFVTHEESLVSRKFYDDHIGGGNQEEQKKEAKKTAARRTAEPFSRITKSSTIKENNLIDINQELEESQKFYKEAHEQVRIQAKQQNKMVQSIFFKSKKEYSILNYDKGEDKFTRQTTKFHYSLALKDNRYFLHHYQQRAKEDDTVQKLTVSDPNSNETRKVYYKLK